MVLLVLLAVLSLIYIVYYVIKGFSGFVEWVEEVDAKTAKVEREIAKENALYYELFEAPKYTRKTTSRNNLNNMNTSINTANEIMNQVQQQQFEDTSRRASEEALLNVTPFEQGGHNIDYGLNPSFQPPDPPQNFGGGML